MSKRYYSLDVFRGATVALMILVNNPGSWSSKFAPLEHSNWNGCTLTDLVFPFFLFAVGNALSFVMPKFRKEGDAYFLRVVFKRALLIFLIGLFLQWCPFFKWEQGELIAKPWMNVGISGVLQRISLCYLFASLIGYYFSNRTIYYICGGILLTYWLLCFVLGSAPDPYSLQGFWGTRVEINLLGASHVHGREGVLFDNEGLVSTLPAIVQVLLGYFTGEYIQRKGKSYEMLSNLFVASGILMFAGYCWDMVFPVNKKMWTSSYVIYTSGLAIGVLGILIFLIEFKEVKGKWSKFFDVFGKNTLFIYFLSECLPRVLSLIRINNGISGKAEPVYVTPFGWFYEHVCKNISGDLRIGSLMYAIILIFFYWLVGYWMDKKKIYVKV